MISLSLVNYTLKLFKCFHEDLYKKKSLDYRLKREQNTRATRYLLTEEHEENKKNLSNRYLTGKQWKEKTKKKPLKNCTCDGRSVEISVDFQPRLRSGRSSGTFRSALKYPSILGFSPSNPEPRSPAESCYLVGWMRLTDRPAVFKPRDVNLDFFTA